MWYIYTTEYYSAIKKNKIMPFAAIWMDLEIIILTKISQRQIPYDIIYMWNLNYYTDFPGGLVMNTLCFQCRGCRFNPWTVN